MEACRWGGPKRSIGTCQLARTSHTRHNIRAAIRDKIYVQPYATTKSRMSKRVRETRIAARFLLGASFCTFAIIRITRVTVDAH